MAREHALMAVENDDQTRVWYVDSSEVQGGVLFKCAQGAVDLESPVGARPLALCSGLTHICVRPMKKASSS